MVEPSTGAKGERQEQSRPGDLDRAIKLTSPSSWLLLSVLALCIGSIVTWGLLGRLSVYVNGPGVIERIDGRIAEIVATAEGTVETITIQAGAQVKEGDLLFTLALAELTAQRDAAAATLKSQTDEFDRFKTQADADVKKRQANVEDQIKSLQANLDDQQKNLAKLQEIEGSEEELLDQGIVTQTRVQTAFAALIAVRQSIRESQDKIGTLQLEQIEFEDHVSKNIAELRLRVITAQGRLDYLQAQLDFGGKVIAPADGLVTEVTTEVGRIVNAGDQLATLESGGQELRVRGYLPIGKGKRVETDMTAEISPTSVRSDIYGSARGTVQSVSRLPVSEGELRNLYGNDELVAEMTKDGAPIEVLVGLVADQATVSGFKWTSSEGPPAELTPGTTADVRVLTAERAPITLFLPILETWLDPQ